MEPLKLALGVCFCGKKREESPTDMRSICDDILSSFLQDLYAAAHDILTPIVIQQSCCVWLYFHISAKISQSLCPASLSDPSSTFQRFTEAQVCWTQIWGLLQSWCCVRPHVCRTHVPWLFPKSHTSIRLMSTSVEPTFHDFFQRVMRLSDWCPRLSNPRSMIFSKSHTSIRLMSTSVEPTFDDISKSHTSIKLRSTSVEPTFGNTNWWNKKH